MPWVCQTLWAIQIQVQLNMSVLITSVYFWIPSYHSHMLCLPSVLILNKMSMCKQLFSFLPRCIQMQPLNFWHIELTPLSQQDIDTFWHRAFPCDWSVIGTLHLLSAPNALWVFSRHDPIIPYFSPGRGKLTNNARISHITLLLSLLLNFCGVTHTHTNTQLH